METLVVSHDCRLGRSVFCQLVGGLPEALRGSGRFAGTVGAFSQVFLFLSCVQKKKKKKKKAKARAAAHANNDPH